jgi:hypothetical protein
MTRKEIAMLAETGNRSGDSDIVSVAGGNYIRIRVDNDTRIRLTTDISTDTLQAVWELFKARNNPTPVKVMDDCCG